MITAIVLLTVERDRVNSIAGQLTDMKGISEVYSVAGKYDLVVVIRTSNHEGVAELVTDKLLKIKGIVKSETLIAFKVYSKHDLESMFSIGSQE